jgi:thiol-disulfide isomerase/thioredoxin
MNMMKSTFLAVLSFLLLAVPAWTAGESPAVTPDFSTSDIAGNPLTLSEFRGKIVLLDFWATWCPPCRLEVPHLLDIFREYPRRDFVIISISLDRDTDAAGKFVQEKGMNWRHIMDRDAAGRIADLYQVQYIPSTFLLDRSGRLAARDLRGGELKAKIGQLLK